MGRGDAVDLLIAVFLVQSHRAEDGRKHHTGRVNPDKVAMETDGAARLDTGNLRRADGVPGGRCVHHDGGGSESDVKVDAGGTGLNERRARYMVVVLLLGAAGYGHGGDERREGDEAERLVDLQVVGALIEPGLQLRIRLALRGGEPEVAERRCVRRLLLSGLLRLGLRLIRSLVLRRRTRGVLGNWSVGQSGPIERCGNRFGGRDGWKMRSRLRERQNWKGRETGTSNSGCS